MEAAPPSERPRGFFSAVPRNVKSLVYLMSPTMVAAGYMGVLIAAYFPQIGIGSASIGLILGSNGLAMVVSAIPLGILSDRVERKRILVPAGMVFPFCLLTFALTTNLAFLVLASIGAGIAEGAFLSTWNALIADQTTPENRNSAFALSFIVTTVASGVGLALPFAFPTIEHATGWGSHSLHAGAMALLAVSVFPTPVGLFLLLRGYREPPRERTKFRWGNLRPLLLFSGLNGLVGLGAGFLIPLIPTWLYLKFGVPDTYSGPLLALAGLTIGLAAVTSAGLARRFGQIRAVTMVQGLATVLMLSLVAMPTALLAGAVYVVRAMLMNMASPLLDSFLMGIVPKDQRGVASAVNSLIWRLPNSITTVLGGIILAGGDYNLPVLLASGFYAIGITGLYAFFRNVKPGG